jgi:hypothetical protein
MVLSQQVCFWPGQNYFHLIAQICKPAKQSIEDVRCLAGRRRDDLSVILSELGAQVGVKDDAWLVAMTRVDDIGKSFATASGSEVLAIREGGVPHTPQLWDEDPVTTELFQQHLNQETRLSGVMGDGGEPRQVMTKTGQVEAPIAEPFHEFHQSAPIYEFSSRVCNSCVRATVKESFPLLRLNRIPLY